MKKLLLTVASFAACASAFAQDDAQQAAAEAAAAFAQAPETEAAVPKPKYWKASSVFDLGFNQTYLSNWAAGGFNNIALAAGIDAKAEYAKDLVNWSNRLQLQYGFIWSQDKENILQKSTDRIYLESKFAYKTSAESKWNWTASYDFRSQFTNTYNGYSQLEDGTWTVDEAKLKSGFISPAYNNLALGIEWKPVDWFNVNISPVTGSVVICEIPALRKAYGMKPLEPDLEEAGYMSYLIQFGASVKANAKFAVNDVFTYETQLVLFTDYLNKPILQNRVNWDNKITWQIAKNFKIGFDTWLIYDPIVEIDGVKGKVQFKDYLAINFTYTLAGK